MEEWWLRIDEWGIVHYTLRIGLTCSQIKGQVQHHPAGQLILWQKHKKLVLRSEVLSVTSWQKSNKLIQISLIIFGIISTRRRGDAKIFEVLEERSSLQLTLPREFADNHSATWGCDYGGRRGGAETFFAQSAVFLPPWWLSFRMKPYCAFGLCESLLAGTRPKAQ